MVLSIDELPGEDAEQLRAWLEPILEAVEVEVVVSFSRMGSLAGSPASIENR